MKNLLLLAATLVLLLGCNDDEGGEATPTLTTSEVTGISSTEATAGGNITGNVTITSRGVVWGIAANPTIDLSTKTNDGAETGMFTSAITGLQANTTYHVRAYATTNTGTQYGNDVQFTTTTPKLYVCGTEYNPAKSKQQCRVWINGTASFWGSDDESIGQGLFVSGADLYVAGSTKQMNFRATVWKNGTPTYLTDDTREAIAHAVFVVGNDVYVTGYEKNAESVKVAKYWKNGTPHNLTDGTKDAEGMSIVVSDNDVYVSGYETAQMGTHIWKNGSRMSIDGISGTPVPSIYISGTDLFAIGVKSIGLGVDDTWYWKNQTATHLPGAYSVNAITVSGNTVYVAGYDGSNRAAYWGNGTIVLLNPTSSPNSNAKSIFVNGDDVYVVGKIGPDIVYWKNGGLVTISSNPDFRNNGMGIAFK